MHLLCINTITYVLFISTDSWIILLESNMHINNHFHYLHHALWEKVCKYFQSNVYFVFSR